MTTIDETVHQHKFILDESEMPRPGTTSCPTCRRHRHRRSTPHAAARRPDDFAPLFRWT